MASVGPSLADAGITMEKDVYRRRNSEAKPAAEAVSREEAPKTSGKRSMGEKEDKKEVWWANGAFVVFAHVAALLSILLYTPKWQTWVLTAICIQLSTMGITMGYHRLWSHRSFKAGVFLRTCLAVMGTLGFQGSIKWWVLRHRLHHRYTDDPVNDPYAATKGFWFSHMGWIFEKPLYTRMKLVDAADLNADPIVRFQHRHYPYLALFSGFVVPTIIGLYWGDALGSYLYAGFVTRVVVWHLTFCINSFAHWIGEQNFSTEMSARGTFLLALLTNGEGHHNFHHEFPKDYRNGLKPLDWDPTKWLIWLCGKLGLASDLYTIPENEIKKAMILTAEKKTNRLREKVNWGPDISQLPTMSLSEMARKVSDEGKELMAIDGYVLDVSEFKNRHPGGSKILKGYYGKDATETFFRGILNNHSLSARTYVEMLRVAKVSSA